MNRVVKNVFSNWAGLVVSIAIAFVVSPIIVNTLGKEIYGIWSLIVSITGYFTVLDFGVNTAIVRYISGSVAKHNYDEARAVYSTSMAIFATVALLIMLFATVFGFLLPSIFGIDQIPRSYFYAVFFVSSLDLACSLLFSVYQGALTGLQQFQFINGTSIIINLLRSLILILLLKHGGGLLSLACLQLTASVIRALCQYTLLNKRFTYLRIDRSSISRKTIVSIYSYSVYSFIIAISLKLLFYTDSVVIAGRIGVAQVAFYAIPSTLLDYLEKYVWAMIAVLIPIISKNETLGNSAENSQFYILGTRYSLLLSMPAILSLFAYGNDFIGLWMGEEFGLQSKVVLQCLLVGYGFSFSQLIAHGILKGTSKHKILAYIMAIEAIANLVLSLVLAKPYGIAGVAVGTMVPLVFASIAIIFYTCSTLAIHPFRYLIRAYSGPLLGIFSACSFMVLNPLQSQGYMSLLLNSAGVSCCFLIIALPVCLPKEQLASIGRYFKSLCQKK